MPNLRPMLPADVDEATEMILSHDWGVRREFLAFATSQPACTPILAESDGAIVGTGVGTMNGSVWWIGTIFWTGAPRMSRRRSVGFTNGNPTSLTMFDPAAGEPALLRAGDTVIFDPYD